jgi:hypothetical protein
MVSLEFQNYPELDEQELTFEELRAFLKNRLADYRIPRLMEIVEACR